MTFRKRGFRAMVLGLLAAAGLALAPAAFAGGHIAVGVSVPGVSVGYNGGGYGGYYGGYYAPAPVYYGGYYAPYPAYGVVYGGPVIHAGYYPYYYHGGYYGHDHGYHGHDHHDHH